MTRGKRGRKRKRNPGWFAKGHDARRHVFTTSDCRLGYWVVMLGLTPKTRDPAVREWVRMKVCIHNRTKEERNGQEARGSRSNGEPTTNRPAADRTGDADIPF